MLMSYREDNYENSIIQLFEEMGYTHICGYDVSRDYQCPLYMDELQNALYRLNPNLPEIALREAMEKITHFENGETVQKNELFTDYLQNGIDISYTHNGQQKSAVCYLADFEHTDNNSFIIANQWTFVENEEKRPDLLVFFNGIPVVLMELKSPSRQETDVSEAYAQIRNYTHAIPSMFIYNQICVMSDMAISKAGTLTSSEDRYMEWKSKDGNYDNTVYNGFDTFFEGIFEKSRFLDILQNFILFSNDGINRIKILAGYHQYFAVCKAITSTEKAVGTDGKGGVFWHTQGSGKSLSMVFYAHLLQKTLNAPTIVVITDRNDLDDQLFRQFARCRAFLRQDPVQAKSRQHLKELLSTRKANGIFFTTMQKFEESAEPLSERKNIVVMTDEAHRGQSGLALKTTLTKDETGQFLANRSRGTARIIRDTLPNATYIGFTGTPLSLADRNTREVFGDYIDIYDMTQAVKDGATRPVYYESRVIHLKLDEETLAKIDREYEAMAQYTDEETLQRSKKKLGQMEALLGNDNTINSLVNDILFHYENYRENLLTGKAMIVAYSREIAIKIYQRILQLRPNWQEKIAVVMTSGNKDPEEWYEIIGNKSHKDELAIKFKDNDSPLKIAIVVDMWLTGFDVPSLATMYIYKPMTGHNLMQAIARVNRVFKEKEGGLIVDYVGIANALRQAMNDYTVRDRKNYGNTDIKSIAYPKFQEKLSLCQDFLYGFDYTDFFSKDDLKAGRTITGAVNFLLQKANTEQRLSQNQSDTVVTEFIKEAHLLKQALSLCASVATEKELQEASFFEVVRVLLLRTSSHNKKLTLPKINERINELLKQSVKSEGVICLFNDRNEEFSLFDPQFLDDIARMKEKNLAIELLKKLIAEQVYVYQKTNLVKSETFSKIMQQTMNRYLNGMLTNEEVIEEMLNLARQIRNATKQGEELGLTTEELAFYDALTRPQAIKDFYTNQELIALTKELTQQLRNSRTIDWQKRNSARASMRMMIRRLLKKHRYPPEGMNDAITIVMNQCELWADTQG